MSGALKSIERNIDDIAKAVDQSRMSDIRSISFDFLILVAVVATIIILPDGWFYRIFNDPEFWLALRYSALVGIPSAVIMTFVIIKRPLWINLIAICTFFVAALMALVTIYAYRNGAHGGFYAGLLICTLLFIFVMAPGWNLLSPPKGCAADRDGGRGAR